MEDELLTIDEVASALKVKKSYVYKLMKEREIIVVKRGKRFTRILRSDLMAYVQKYRQEAQPSKGENG